VSVAFRRLEQDTIRTVIIPVSSYASYTEFLEKFADRVLRAAGPWEKVKDWIGRFVRHVKPQGDVDLFQRRGQPLVWPRRRIRSNANCARPIRASWGGGKERRFSDVTKRLVASQAEYYERLWETTASEVVNYIEGLGLRRLRRGDRHHKDDR
jgi:hypothetical protein